MLNDAPPDIRYSVAKLMEIIGRNSNLDVDYGPEESGANKREIPPFFEKLGYNSGNRHDGYNVDVVKEALNSTWPRPRPVLARGNDTRIKVLGVTVGYKGGHVWVIDGYREKRQQTRTTIYFTHNRTGTVWSKTESYTSVFSTLIHNNWGWDGKDNGFFASGCFDSNLTPESASLRSSVEDNYQFNNDLYPHIWVNL